MDKNKKISFAFTKLSKKPIVLRTAPVEEKKVELVECLEGQSIKVKDAPVVELKEPLVIPIKNTKNSLIDRIKDARIKRESVKQIKEEDVKPDSELTIDELAAKALIQEAKNRLENNPVVENKISVLPIKDETVQIEGEKEPTLEDYESVPVSDYGLAMLRGMGWKEGMGIGKSNSTIPAVSIPELRPKGLGLGATKIIKKEESPRDKDGKELILKRGAYAKIIAGSHKGKYCEVQGLDDEAGTVIVRTALKGEILTLNEFLLVPVTETEFTQSSKVLNNAKYEEYKEIADRKLEKQRKEETVTKKNNSDGSERNLESEGKSTRKREEQKSKRSTERCSNDNVKNESDNERKSRSERYRDETKRENHKSKHRDDSASSDESRKKYRDSSESDSRSSRKKKRKDKKKKDKHRDRSSRSRKSDKKSESRHRDRSTSYDSKKQESSKKHKSKSKYKNRSVSNSPDREYRRKRSKD